MTSRQDSVEILKKVRPPARMTGLLVKRKVCLEALLRLGSVPKEDEIPGDPIRDFFALREVALKSPGHHIKAFEFLRAECDIPVIGVLREPRKELFEIFDFHKVGMVIKKVIFAVRIDWASHKGFGPTGRFSILFLFAMEKIIIFAVRGVQPLVYPSWACRSFFIGRVLRRLIRLECILSSGIESIARLPRQRGHCIFLGLSQTRKVRTHRSGSIRQHIRWPS